MREPQETQVLSLGQEDPLKEAVTTHCSILAWRIPRPEKPGRLWSAGWAGFGRVGSQVLS